MFLTKCTVVILLFELVISQYSGFDSRDPNAITLLHQSTTQVNSVADRLIEVETIVRKLSAQLTILEGSIGRQEGVENAEKLEMKRQLGIVFSKLENIDFDISGFSSDLDTIQKDLEFLKKGFNGLFDLIPNTSGAPVQCQTDSDSSQKSGRESRILTSVIKQLQGNVKSFNIVMNSLQTSMVSLNGKVDNLQTNRNSDKKTDDASINSDQLEHIEQMLLKLATSIKVSETVKSLPRDCSKIENWRGSGVYKIQPNQLNRPKFVFCQEDQDLNHWTVIQRRSNGKVQFHQKSLEEYRSGFGNPWDEYWLGLDSLNVLTELSEEIFELKIELTDFHNKTVFISYDMFGVSNLKSGHQISLLGDYQGTAGDYLKAGMAFKTSVGEDDIDCYTDEKIGGWWFPDNQCFTKFANLNGRYNEKPSSGKLEGTGIFWNGFHGSDYSLQQTKMMIRPKTI